MRNLIRPTVRAGTRLGLFLAIVAWAVGQWWWCAAVFPFTNTTGAVHLSAHGWTVTHQGRLLTGQLTLLLRDDHDVDGWLFEKPAAVHRGGTQQLRASMDVAGVVYSDYDTIRHAAFRHWLVIGLWGIVHFAAHFAFRATKSSAV